jgi:hypothetical protein
VRTHGRLRSAGPLAWVFCLGLAGCRAADLPAPVGSPSQGLPVGQYSPRPQERRLPWPEADADRMRALALARAKVWSEPAVPISRADLSQNPGGSGAFSPRDEVTCRFLLKESEGLTPKFQCTLVDGEVVKVKYGRRNAEVYAEPAATRLVRALGFGADLVSVVKSVRCHGCPAFPYPRLEILDAIQMDEARITVFQMATVERPFPGLDIEGREIQGWGFDELSRISAEEGGASRDQVDALRLLAVFLAHWDNKPANQRLACPPGQETQDPPGCRAPLALIQDLGKSFGPHEINVVAWRDRPIWADPETCRVSMRDLPYEGASFPDVQISEGGRRLLARLLGELRGEQVTALFTGARFAEFSPQPAEGKDMGAWAAAFKGRVRQIAERRPCPK